MLLQMVDHTDALTTQVDRSLEEMGLVEDGDLVVITAGSPLGKAGSTNSLKVHKVGDLADSTRGGEIVFHLDDSYALLSGALPAGHITSGAALRGYLLHTLGANGTRLDFDVKIARSTPPAPDLRQFPAGSPRLS